MLSSQRQRERHRKKRVGSLSKRKEVGKQSEYRESEQGKMTVSKVI